MVIWLYIRQSKELTAKQSMRMERRISYMVMPNEGCRIVIECKTRAIVGFKAISNNKSAIGMSRKEFKKKVL